MGRNNYDLAKLSDFVDGHWAAKQIALIRDQVAAKASPGELALFLQVAKSRGLDPFAKQIHAVHRWDPRKKREVMSIQVGIDGYRAIAERTGDYVGNDDPVFLEDGEKHPVAATVTVWRLVAGQRCAFTATARWSEYAATKKGGELVAIWRRMPYLMLGKCAEALALRKAFPSSLSGIYTDAEMDQAGEVIEAEVVRTERDADRAEHAQLISAIQDLAPLLPAELARKVEEKASEWTRDIEKARTTVAWIRGHLAEQDRRRAEEAPPEEEVAPEETEPAPPPARSKPPMPTPAATKGAE